MMRINPMSDNSNPNGAGQSAHIPGPDGILMSANAEARAIVDAAQVVALAQQPDGTLRNVVAASPTPIQPQGPDSGPGTADSTQRHSGGAATPGAMDHLGKSMDVRP